MKLIIAGSRTLSPSVSSIAQYIQSSAISTCILEVICGGARGVDSSGNAWAAANRVPIRFFEAEWGVWGKQAGFLRNMKMAEYADALLLIWDGKSKGSAHMKRCMLKLGKPVWEVVL